MKTQLLSHWMRLLASSMHVLLIVLVTLRGDFGKGSLLALPLFLPLAGILRGRRYTYSWASMMLAFYAAGYLSVGYAEPQNKWVAFGIATVAALDFVALVLYVRFLARERIAQGLRPS